MTSRRAPKAQGLALSVRAGSTHFSLSAEDAGEILRAPKITRVPNAPAALDGIASLRGTVLPVFSLARLLDLPDAAADTRPLVIVLAAHEIGLRVDAVATLTQGDTQTDLIHPLDIEMLARNHLQAVIGTSRPPRAGSAAPQARAVLADGIALLGFELAGQNYALPLEHVDEVLATPEGATQLPQSEAGDLGVVLLREALLPLISLRALLGLTAPSHEHARHVIVARLGRARIGLAVDRLTSVKRAREYAISAVPSILNRGGGEARISSIFRGDDGRLTSILSPERLFADPRIAQQLDGVDQELEPMQTEAQAGAQEQIVVFRLGLEEFGLPISAVDEIARLPDAPTRVPRAPSFVKGVMNLRGRIVPLIDQGARFGLATDGDSVARKRVIVTRVADLLAGFIVDEVREILIVPASQMRVSPSVGSTDPQTFDRVAMLDGDSRMILIIDPQELLNRAERDVLAHENWTAQDLAES